MKRLYTSILAFLMALSIWAEAPQTISYQAVVRNNVGRLLREKPVGVRITILQGDENGKVVYTESRVATTNNNGLLTFAIGDDQAETSDNLAKIDWANHTYYLRCEMDPEGGNSYTLNSTSQMASVPYALYAKNIAPEALPSWAQSEEKPVYNYTEIVNAPDVPTNVSQLENDKKYITLKEVPTVTVPTKVSELENDKKYLTEHQSLKGYAKTADIPSLDDYAKKSELPVNVGDLPNNVGYITKAKFDGIVDSFNSVITKYTKPLDSIKNVMVSMASSGYTRSVAIDNGALPGLFSVSADKQVKFSMGNLQYQATTGTWRFAFNQYDYVGSPNSNIAEDYSGWIDLFGWGTSGYHNSSDTYNKNYMPYSTSTSQVNTTYNYYGYGPSTNQTDKNLVGTSAEYDWGVHNAISNGGNEAGQWRVLTKDEWSYLYSGRTNAAKLRTRATVEGVAGYVFFPDNWVQPDGISVSLDASAFTTNNYSTIRWNVLEAQGAVFLPAAGYRNGTSVNYVGSYGLYWSSTYDYSYSAYIFYFNSSIVSASVNLYRYYGRSVRLVQE